MDNKGVGWRNWRNTKHKDLPPLKISKTNEAITGPEDFSDGFSHHGWRRTIHLSRPQTPVTPAEPVSEPTERAPSERSEGIVAHRNSRPKLKRITSLFSDFKDATKEPKFDEPWSEDAPPPPPAFVDPLMVEVSVRSHMSSSPRTPIPLDHNSGLFHLFHDYRKTKDELERLKTLLEDTLHDWTDAQEQWDREQTSYQEEIKRLELLIARGATGMSGLFQARQGSVIDRTRKHRSVALGEVPKLNEANMQPDQLEKEIRIRSQRASLHRPTSPSSKMTALSSQFSTRQIGYTSSGPPKENQIPTLSQRLDQKRRPKLAQRRELVSTPVTPDLGLAESIADCEAFTALRELAKLVARRRSLDVDNFLRQFMALLSEPKYGIIGLESIQVQQTALASSTSASRHRQLPQQERNLTPSNKVRRYGSHPRVRPKSSHRHFSFEPGEDDLRTLDNALEEHRLLQQREQDTYRSTQSSKFPSDYALGTCERATPSRSQTLFVDGVKPSKIPSPVQTLGRIRRQTSASSLQSVLARPQDGPPSARGTMLWPAQDASENQQQVLRSKNSSVTNLSTTANLSRGDSDIAGDASRQ